MDCTKLYSSTKWGYCTTLHSRIHVQLQCMPLTSPNYTVVLHVCTPPYTSDYTTLHSSTKCRLHHTSQKNTYTAVYAIDYTKLHSSTKCGLKKKLYHSTKCGLNKIVASCVNILAAGFRNMHSVSGPTQLYLALCLSTPMYA
jgi:hypothetical protein